MKNIYIYYITIILPFAVIIWLSRIDAINATSFVALLFFYLFVFRTYVDGRRLYEKGVIPKKDIWRMTILGKQTKYFNELYWE